MLTRLATMAVHVLHVVRAGTAVVELLAYVPELTIAGILGAVA
jgi:hypothetical protein